MAEEYFQRRCLSYRNRVAGTRWLLVLLAVGALSPGRPVAVAAADPRPGTAGGRAGADVGSRTPGVVGGSGFEPGAREPDEGSTVLDRAVGVGEFDGADELMLFADLPVVISASRQAQPINQSAVPISILTRETIHASGLTSVPDLLLFMPALDVLWSDRNTVSIGVRGLHHQFADRTLALIDGRNASNPVFGGADFARLPLFTEDISRIEVVRGPGGAAWGANAFNGVINIITVEPEDVLGFTASSTVNEYGDTHSYFRWAARGGDWVWRLSAGYEEQESSDDAVAGDKFFSRDFRRDPRVNAEAILRSEPGSKLTLGAAGMHQERGDFEFIGFPLSPTDPRADDRLDVVRLYARFDHEAEPGSSAYVQWFGNYEDVNQHSLWRYQSYENDLEAQVNRRIGGAHRLSFGGNVRLVTIETAAARPTDLIPAGDSDEVWLGLFVIDRWKATDRLTFEGQGRVDWYSQTTTDWSGRVTALVSLDDRDQQVLRFSGAKAFRAPLLFIRDGAFERFSLGPPAPPGLFAINLVDTGDPGHEEVWSAEAGYSAKLGEGLSFSVDSYYQRYSDLIGAETLPDPLALGRLFSRLDNIDGATAAGVEVSLAWDGQLGGASVWYAYNGFSEDRGDQNLRAFRPARHKVGANGWLKFGDGWRCNALYRFTGETEMDPSGTGSPDSVDSYHRLDLTVSKTLGAGELLVGVSDLLDETDQTIAPLGSLTAHETPGRTFFVRVQISH